MNTKHRMHQFPFSAIVGQDDMKLALLLNAIDPRIGGVLIRGYRGTAKSTAARAFASLLPEIEAVETCPFNCNPQDRHCPHCAAKLAAGEKLPVSKRKVPFANLPLGASEDRVLGSIDIERAIKKGEKHFEPGLIAKAHRGILYVDEVNLLDDHLVDLLLDVAAAGFNTVEREGISFSHPARFILIGTMNPEEGELRPQLLDRFGLCVEVETESDIDTRTTIVKNRLAFESDPESFTASWLDADRELGHRVERAQRALPDVICPDEMIEVAAKLCAEFGTDGHRAEIAIVKTAKALSAFEGLSEIGEAQIHRAAELVLPHRLKKRSQRQEQKQQDNLKEQLKKQRSSPPPPANAKDGDEKKKTLPRNSLVKVTLATHQHHH